jgi:ABC-2 type transport system ATP-binding protein
MITIKDLTVSYSTELKILDSLNLMLGENQIHGIVGLNGAGKTTLFETIFGFKQVNKGMIQFNDHAISKKDIAYLPAEEFFYSFITGREYMALFYNPQFNLKLWNELLKLPLDQIIDEYSTGMKKKLAIMGVIKQNKPVMLLDEPFNGLDIEMCRIFRSVLLRLKETGKTIIVSSHVMETLTNLCDFIHYLEKGNIKYSKPKEDFETFEKEIFAMIEKDNTKTIDELLNSNKND